MRGKTEPLYGSADIIGRFLSASRMRTVIPHILKGQLIDLACGDNRLVRKLGKGIGVDINNYGHANIVQNDFSDLPFENESIATITIMAALNYFDNPVEVLKELRRILIPEGRIIVTLLDKRISMLWHKLRDRGLKRVAYSQNELESRLKQSGLVISKKYKFMLGVNIIYIITKEKISRLKEQ